MRGDDEGGAEAEAGSHRCAGKAEHRKPSWCVSRGHLAPRTSHLTPSRLTHRTLAPSRLTHRTSPAAAGNGCVATYGALLGEYFAALAADEREPFAVRFAKGKAGRVRSSAAEEIGGVEEIRKLLLKWPFELRLGKSRKHFTVDAVWDDAVVRVAPSGDLSFIRIGSTKLIKDKAKLQLLNGAATRNKLKALPEFNALIEYSKGPSEGRRLPQVRREDLIARGRPRRRPRRRSNDERIVALGVDEVDVRFTLRFLGSGDAWTQPHQPPAN